MNKTTFSLLEPVVAAIDRTFTATSITDNTTSYTIFSENTLWLTLGHTITIDAVDYLITEIDPNVSVTITGASLPTLLEFEIYAPFFRHGTIMATNLELQMVKDEVLKYPMIFLHDIVVEDFKNSKLSAIERESDCMFYFMTFADFNKWLTNDHEKYAAKPMRNLLFRFIDALNSSSLVWEIDSYTVADQPKWGVYIKTGAESQMLDDPLSGTSLKITIQFLHNCIC